MTTTRKPVIVRKFSRDWCAGYAGASLGQNSCPGQNGANPGAAELEILDLGGKVLRIGWDQVKWVCYVRDFPANTGDQANPERLMHKRFSIRPRTAGLCELPLHPLAVRRCGLRHAFQQLFLVFGETNAHGVAFLVGEMLA